MNGKNQAKEIAKQLTGGMWPPIDVGLKIVARRHGPDVPTADRFLNWDVIGAEQDDRDRIRRFEMIVVTGGAGFIGSNLLAALEAAGKDELIVCDRLRDGQKWRNISKRVLADIVAPEAVLDLIASCHRSIDCVFHMGAISSTTAVDGDLVVRTNFAFSKTLWHACARHDLPFIYASSAATYGAGEAGFTDSNELECLRVLRPLNLYGWSKWLFDAWVLSSAARREQAPPVWAGLRFFNVFGPNEYHKAGMRSLVAKILEAHRPGAPVELFRSYRNDIPHGEQRRDFIVVDDVVSVMMWLLSQQRTAGIVNVGTGVARTFKDLAAATIRATGEEPTIEYIEMPQSLQGAYQYYTCADTGRLRELGYARPFTDLETGVATYVRDYLSKVDPYR